MKNRTLLVVVILILVIGVGFVAYTAGKNKQSQTNTLEQNALSTTQTTQTNQQSPTVPKKSPTVSMDTETYTDTSFGFSFKYPKTISVSHDATGKITWLNVLGGSTENPTTITESTGSVENGSGKFGSYTISYVNNGWVAQQQNEQDGSSYSASITPIAYTASGLPIFGSNTGHGWGMYGYVVALSHTKFLKIYAPEHGVMSNGIYDLNTDSIFQIIKSISLI